MTVVVLAAAAVYVAVFAVTVWALRRRDRLDAVDPGGAADAEPAEPSMHGVSRRN